VGGDVPAAAMWRSGWARAVILVASGGVGACAHTPPPDFAPDPGLVARIESIRIFVPAAVCPGGTVRASYSATLRDGTEIPFATRYDDDHPPELHVVFLSRYSPNAVALENGDWDTDDDPLLSAMEGFALRATLRANRAVHAEEILIPDYACSHHAFGFIGDRGTRGEAGGPGPDVVVRLAVLASPFYRRLIVAGVHVEDAPPFYVLADAAAVPSADWLVIESRGGRGGRGMGGETGRDGSDGVAGCPGTGGGAGGAGGNGSAGGPGGRGGRITVFVPVRDRFLAGLVDVRTPGGEGGEGGPGGAGGDGGKGGAVQGDRRRCSAGADGPDGRDGRAGVPGADGVPGLRAQVITVPAKEVFGARIPPELAALINYEREEDR